MRTSILLIISNDVLISIIHIAVEMPLWFISQVLSGKAPLDFAFLI